MQLSARLYLFAACVLAHSTLTKATLVSYWNVPLETCCRHGVAFDLDQFDIVHNTRNVFKGDKVNILYQPGRFPHYTSTREPVNGGIPQKGNLSLHLATFRQQLQFLPANYSGLLVLDFEEYLPTFSISLPSVYRDQSIAWVRQRHPNWTHSTLLQEAERTFNASVRPYFELLLQEALKQHPASLVGYYHYPYCEDYEPPFLHCAPKLQELNDDLRPGLLNSSSALYPSLYLQDRYSATRQWRVVRAKLTETQRIKKTNVPVLPYLRYRYGGIETLVERPALLRLLWLVRTHHAEGLVVWGTPRNLSNLKSCLEFRDYLYNTLGPVLKCFRHMTDEDVDEIRRKFSSIENQFTYFHYRTGSHGYYEDMWQNYSNDTWHVHPDPSRDRFQYKFVPLNQVHRQKYVIERGTFNGDRANNFAIPEKRIVNFPTTNISPYLDASELFLLTKIIQQHCKL